MTQIKRKKAVFRVEFHLYACDEEEFSAMAQQLQFHLSMLEVQARLCVEGSPSGGIAAIAKVHKVRRLSR